MHYYISYNANKDDKGAVTISYFNSIQLAKFTFARLSRISDTTKQRGLRLQEWIGHSLNLQQWVWKLIAVKTLMKILIKSLKFFLINKIFQ